MCIAVPLARRENVLSPEPKRHKLEINNVFTASKYLHFRLRSRVLAHLLEKRVVVVSFAFRLICEGQAPSSREK